MRWILLAGLLFAQVPVGTGIVVLDAPVPHYGGWAIEAYPELSISSMEAILRRMVQAGANVVWIGHNNPGEVEAGKVEPGLSYAVYEAYRDRADPRHAAAVAIVQAQRRMLQACRAVGIRAVLPVGYQIQMGKTWNSRHPADLRRDPSGQPLNIYGGGVSASFYAASYRRSILTYYRWVDASFVRPFADVVLMLNLADEPIGGDYSPGAEAEFRRRTAYGFADVGDDPELQQVLGEFQARYVVDYAAFSAGLWQAIHPGLPVTMSFDGAQARATFTMPDVERLFSDTPSNFVVTFDAYPHDGLPDTPATRSELVSLFLLARSLGLYSSRYGKPLWLWAAANSWGLSGGSPDPGTVSDAVANGLYLTLLARQGGGNLQGVVYWSYNVKAQGLYNDTHLTAYSPDTLFAQASSALHTLRRLMTAPAGRPDILILLPPTVAHRQIGAASEAVRTGDLPHTQLDVLAGAGSNAAVVGTLSGWSLHGLRAILVLAPSVEYVSREDFRLLHFFLARGGKVVVSARAGTALADGAGALPQSMCEGLVERRGSLYLTAGDVAALFQDRGDDVLAPLWHEVAGLDGLQPGYRVVTDRVALFYHVGPEPAHLRLELPYEAIGYRYDALNQPAERVHGPYRTVTLGRREYLLLWRLRPHHIRAE